jgi:hypothetical protein
VSRAGSAFSIPTTQPFRHGNHGLPNRPMGTPAPPRRPTTAHRSTEQSALNNRSGHGTERLWAFANSSVRLAVKAFRPVAGTPSVYSVPQPEPRLVIRRRRGGEHLPTARRRRSADWPPPPRPATSPGDAGGRFVLHTVAGPVSTQSLGFCADTPGAKAIAAPAARAEGVVQLSVERGASVKPAGDLIRAQVLNRDVDAVLAAAGRARRFGPVSVSTAEAQSVVAEHVARAIDEDVDEAPWEEIERTLRHHARMNWNYLILMAIEAVIAFAGLVSSPVAQALGLRRPASSHRRLSRWPSCAWAWSGAVGMPCGAR